MSPLTLGRRRLRFPDPPCPRGSSLWDARRKNACTTRRGANTLGSRSRRCWFRAKASGPPSKTGAMPLCECTKFAEASKEETRAESGQQKSEVIHPGETAPVLWLGMLLRDWCLSLHQRPGAIFGSLLALEIPHFLFFFSLCFFLSGKLASFVGLHYTACPRCLNSSMFACGWLPCARAICTFPLLSKDRVAHGRLGRPAMWPPDTRASRHS